MNTTGYRTFRWAMIVLAVVYCIGGGAGLAAKLSDSSDISFEDWAFGIRGLVVMAIGIVIAWKLRQADTHILFAFFLINFGFNSWLFLLPRLWWLDALSWSLTGASFIHALIHYPGTAAKELYADYFPRQRSPRWFKRGVLYFTDSKKFWSIFFPSLLALRIGSSFISPVLMQSLNIVVMIAGLLYFGASYRLTEKRDRSRLAWVLWGIVVSVMLVIAEIVVRVFFPEAPRLYFQFSASMMAATAGVSLVMAVFFAGFLNTGLVIRKTIVYSVIFLVVLFLFSTIEHYAVHELSVMLHIENDMLDAFFASFLALLVEPLHKRLEHLLPKF